MISCYYHFPCYHSRWLNELSGNGNRDSPACDKCIKAGVNYKQLRGIFPSAGPRSFHSLMCKQNVNFNLPYCNHSFPIFSYEQWSSLVATSKPGPPHCSMPINLPHSSVKICPTGGSAQSSVVFFFPSNSCAALRIFSIHKFSLEKWKKMDGTGNWSCFDLLNAVLCFCSLNISTMFVFE